jgi:hypothetical protein
MSIHERMSPKRGNEGSNCVVDRRWPHDLCGYDLDIYDIRRLSDWDWDLPSVRLLGVRIYE